MSGACESGSCAAARVVTTTALIEDFAVNETDVYYAERDKSSATRIMRVKADGGTPTMLANLVTAQTTGELELNNERVFWLMTNGDVFSMPLAGGDSALANPMHTYTSGDQLFVEGQLVFVQNESSLFQVSLATGSETVIRDNAFFMRGIDHGTLYGTSLGQIAVIESGEDTPKTLATSFSNMGGMTVSMGRAYWSGRASGATAPTLMMRPLSGGVEMLVEDNVLANCIAVDDESIYYAIPYLRRRPLNGGTSEQIGSSTWQIRLSSSYVYWSEDRGIRRLPKAH